MNPTKLVRIWPYTAPTTPVHEAFSTHPSCHLSIRLFFQSTLLFPFFITVLSAITSRALLTQPSVQRSTPFPSLTTSTSSHRGVLCHLAPVSSIYTSCSAHVFHHPAPIAYLILHSHFELFLSSIISHSTKFLFIS